MEIILAIVLGTLFGFVLQRAGAADPDKIIGMLNLTDLHLMKAIFSAIGMASALFFLGVVLGVTDTGHVSIKAMYWSVIAGGLLLGFGWALCGFCPGTGVVAAGYGRLDGLFFVLGGLAGAGVFTVVYVHLQGTWIQGALFGGKASLVETGSSSALFGAGWGQLVAVALGVLMIVIAKFLPEHFRQ